MATELIRKYDVSYVKTTLLLCKYHVLTFSQRKSYVPFMLEKLSKKSVSNLTSTIRIYYVNDYVIITL